MREETRGDEVVGRERICFLHDVERLEVLCAYLFKKKFFIQCSVTNF